MTRKTRQPPCKAPQCGLCGQQDGKLSRCEGGYLCSDCLSASRQGRDNTTRAMRATKIGMREEATSHMYRHWGDEASADRHDDNAADFAEKADALLQPPAAVSPLAGGEMVARSPHGSGDAQKAPDVVSLDASAHRLQLLDLLGTDCAAMALDAADSIQAGSSLEKMLAHQLAVAHKSALEIVGKATFEQNVVDQARLLNLAARMMETFQKGLLTLQRLRGNCEQRIIVQYVTVAEGAQAVIGAVNPGGDKK